MTAAWQEIGDSARDLGLLWPSSRTPRGTARWLASLPVDGPTLEAARRLASSVEQVRYAPADVVELVADGSAADLAGRQLAATTSADARAVIKAMTAAVPAKARWRARLLPASVLTTFSETATDAMDLFDRGLSSLSGGLRSLRPRTSSR